MAQFRDFVGRLFPAGSSRGLSGDVDLVLPGEPELAFYNEGLARHRAEGDLVTDPEQLWGRRRGLSTHLAGSYSEGVLDFTDILIIINRADWARAVPGPASTWPDEAARAMSACFMRMCEEQDIHLLFPQRPMQFHIIQDGGPRMESEALGLQTGEFVTGLLSNQYGRPTASSRALIAVHLNLPGTWEGYYEVGRLYNDQALFTLGNHWLDNFSHPSLPRPALYRLQQQADGSFIHVIDPDVADQFELSTADSPDGPSVVTITDINDEPVAHLVLEVVSEAMAADTDARTRLAPSNLVAPAAPVLDKTAGDRAITAIYDQPRVGASVSSDVTRTRSVIPEQVGERILTLRERGALLQKVHFNRFMLGYDVYIGRNGEVGTAIEEPVATLQVRNQSVMLISHSAELLVNDQPLVEGEPVPLEGDAELSLGGQVMLYRDLRDVAVDGWPYVGELRRRSSSPIHLLFGQIHQLGRARACRVSLPDRPHNDNIIWRPEVGEGATIRARNGEIPKSQFYTDSIMVASQHAEIDLTTEPVLHSAARHCFTFVRRGQDVFALSPTRGRGGPTNIDLQPGDQILIGNSVFEVDYPPSDAPRRPAAAAPTLPPPPPLSAAVLAAAIDDEDDAPGEFDLPAAAGLGERGPVPPPVRIQKTGPDSIFRDPLPSLSSAPVGSPPPLPSPDLPEISLPDISPPPPPLSAPMMLDTFDDSLSEDGAPTSLDLEELPSLTPRITPPPLPPLPDEPDLTIPPVDPDNFFSFEELPAPPSDPIDLTDTPTLQGPPPPPVFLDAPVPQDSILDFMDMGLDPEDESPIPPFEEEEPPPPAPEPEPAMEPEPEPEPVVAPEPALPPVPAEVLEAPLPPPISPPPISPPPISPPPMVPATPTLATPTSAPASGEVVVVEEADWQHELSRPGRLTLAGWAVSGEVVVGNHRGAEVIIPENRAAPGQTFAAADYFSVFVRGRRVKLARRGAADGRLEVAGSAVEETAAPEARLVVVRRDPDGEPDFEVVLGLREARMLPDPRARMLALEGDDPMVAALFALGLPLRVPRRLRLGRLEATALYDGTSLRISEYLDSYRQADGSFLPFFVRRGEGPFRTAPEDGAPVVLQAGDLLMVGVAIYGFGAD